MIVEEVLRLCLFKPVDCQLIKLLALLLTTIEGDCQVNCVHQDQNIDCEGDKSPKLCRHGRLPIKGQLGHVSKHIQCFQTLQHL